MPQDTVIDQMNKLLPVEEERAIAPNDGSGDFNTFVNTMEGNPNEIPLEIMQSDMDADLLSAYIKTQDAIPQDLGQLFESVRAGGVLSAMEREAFSEMLKNISPEAFEALNPGSAIREGEYQFPQGSQVDSPRGDYEMNEDMKRKDPSSTVRQGEMLGFSDEVIREGE